MALDAPDLPEGLTIFTTHIGVIRKEADDCRRLRLLFDILKLQYNEADVGDLQFLRKKLAMRSGTTCLPQAFVGNNFVGNYEELQMLVDDGRLQEHLTTHGYQEVLGFRKVHPFTGEPVDPLDDEEEEEEEEEDDDVTSAVTGSMKAVSLATSSSGPAANALLGPKAADGVSVQWVAAGSMTSTMNGADVQADGPLRSPSGPSPRRLAPGEVRIYTCLDGTTYTFTGPAPGTSAVGTPTRQLMSAAGQRPGGLGLLSASCPATASTSPACSRGSTPRSPASEPSLSPSCRPMHYTSPQYRFISYASALSPIAMPLQLKTNASQPPVSTSYAERSIVGSTTGTPVTHPGR